MVDAKIEGAAQDGALFVEALVVAEVVPQAQRDGRELQAAAADAAVGHGFVAVFRRGISHTFHPASCDRRNRQDRESYAAG